LKPDLTPEPDHGALAPGPGLGALAATFEAMRATRSPRVKEAKLAALLAAASSADDDLRAAARLAAGATLAAGDARSTGVGWALLGGVATSLLGWPADVLRACAGATGDLAEAIGLLLARVPGAEERPGLSFAEVAALFEGLASTGRPAHKARLLTDALGRTTPLEAKYLLRALGGGLRVGAQETLAVAATARAFHRDLEAVRRAFARAGDAGEIAVHARDDRLDEARFVIGRPVAFMLASPHESVRSPLDPAEIVIEDKIDGVRAQLHKRGAEVSIFARGLQRVTSQFPEIADAMRFAPGEVALDGEIVAMGEGDRPRPFQILSERIHRKAPSRALLQEIPVVFVAYDLLADEDGDHLDAPWHERRARLERYIAERAPRPHVRCNPVRPAPSPLLLDAFFDAARGRGQEGLMLKRTGAPYEAGRRGSSWIKVKRAFATLDVVITAAAMGTGKRAGVLSDYTFGVWSGDQLVNIGKAYSGLTDEEIESLTARLSAITEARHGTARLVRPEIVLEVAFDGVQRSTRHKSGFALRFPRIARIRDDKAPSEADTVDAVRAIYEAQLGTGHREEPRASPKPAPKRAPRAKTPDRQLTLDFSVDAGSRTRKEP
jgi:DNA ligase 1